MRGNYLYMDNKGKIWKVLTEIHASFGWFLPTRNISDDDTVVYNYIYLINQARGPCWENIGPKSSQYGPSWRTRLVQKWPRADILPVRSRANEVNKKFIRWLKKIFIDRRGRRNWRIENEQDSIRTFKRRFRRKNNFRMLLNKGIKSLREFFMQTKFIVSLCKPLQRTNRAQDHSEHYPVNNFGSGAIWLADFSYWPYGCLSRVINIHISGSKPVVYLSGMSFR